MYISRAWSILRLRTLRTKKDKKNKNSSQKVQTVHVTAKRLTQKNKRGQFVVYAANYLKPNAISQFAGMTRL